MERKHHFTEGQRIRLKSGGQDAYYEHAMSGSEGWVRGLGYDNVDFPMIAVEWDKEHWAYNGEKDQITYEDHFEVAEEKDMAEPEHEPNIVEWMAAQVGMTEEQVRTLYAERDEGTLEKSSKGSVEDMYEEELATGMDDALQAEAFILITVNAEPNGEGSVALSPTFYQASHNPASILIAQTFLSGAAASAHEKVTDALIEATQNVKPSRER